MLQREATTTDAVVQIHVESLQFIDALRDLLLPAARKRLPIIVGWQFVGGKARKLLADLIERIAYLLREDDEGHSA